jgi:hypothetical protein
MELKTHGAKKTLPEEAHTLPPVTQQQATLYVVRDNDFVYKRQCQQPVLNQLPALLNPVQNETGAN